MNKFKIGAVLISFFIVVEGLALVHFVYKSQGLSKQLQVRTKELASRDPEHKKILKEWSSLKKEHEKLLNEYDIVKKDRANVLLQAKRLMQEQADVVKMKESFAKFKAAEESAEAEKQDILEDNEGLQATIEQLDAELKLLKQENDELVQMCEDVDEGTAMRNLKTELSVLKKEKKSMLSVLKKKNKTEISALKKANKNEISMLKKMSQQEVADLKKESLVLNKNLNKTQKEMDKLSKNYDKAEMKIEKLENNLDLLEKNYAIAEKKNKALEREMKRMPKKFTEIAKQNKALIKETSAMHYNLGVFYTKKKEYKRAAREFRKAIEINPDDEQAYFNLGYIYAEYIVDRKLAIKNFRHYLRLAKGDDEDMDWVKKYLLTWETYEGKGTF